MLQRFFLITALLLPAASSFAQPTEAGIAWPGSTGIFIIVGDDIPLAKGAVSGYRIERRLRVEDEFKPVAELKAIGSAKDIAKGLEQAEKALPYPIRAKQISTDSLWQHAQKGKRKHLGEWMDDLPVRLATNLAWHDATAKSGERYQYRVTPVGGTPRLSHWTTAGQGETLQRVEPVIGNYYERMGRMELHYQVVGLPRPVEFEVLRSDDGAPFEAVMPARYATQSGDTLHFLLVDTTATRYRPLRYALRGWDRFGHAAPAIDTLYCATLDASQMPMPTQLRAQGASDGRGIDISWSLPNAPLVKKLTLYRSTNTEDGFVQVAVISSDRMSFRDEQVSAATSYFYYFVLEYKATHIPMRSASFASVVIDPTPPGPPSHITADATNDGIELRWSQMEQGIESFQIFRSLAGAPFRPLTAMLPATANGQYNYHDKDQALPGDRMVRYTVRALSTSHVEGSFSDTVSVLPLAHKPAPATPMQVEVLKDGDMLTVNWEDMIAADPMVMGYRVVRTRRTVKTNKAVTDTLWRDVNFLVDTIANEGVEHTYRIIAASIFGTRSLPSATVAASRGLETPPPPSGVHALRGESGVQITWRAAATDKAARYEVYRHARGTAPVKLGSVSASDPLRLSDNKAPSGLCFYFVRTVAANGMVSADSTESAVE